jgi:ankyrin repeat protein
LDAVKAGNTGRTIQLISSIGNLEFIDNHDKTPLIYAAENNDPTMIQILIKNGVNVSFCNHEGKSAILYPPKYSESYLWLLDKMLHDLANCLATKNVNSLRKILQANHGIINLNNPLVDKTPLMCAASQGSAPMVQMLLDNGVNANILDKKGHMALYYATTDEVAEIISKAMRKSP